MGCFLDPAPVARGPAERHAAHASTPSGFGPFIVNWEATAAAVHPVAASRPAPHGRCRDPPAPRRAPVVSRRAAALAHARPRRSTAPFLAIDFAGDAALAFFTVLDSLGTPYDITLHELRIECFFPPTRRRKRRCARWRPPGRRFCGPRGGSSTAPAAPGRLRANGGLGGRPGPWPRGGSSTAPAAPGRLRANGGLGGRPGPWPRGGSSTAPAAPGRLRANGGLGGRPGPWPRGESSTAPAAPGRLRANGGLGGRRSPHLRSTTPRAGS